MKQHTRISTDGGQRCIARIAFVALSLSLGLSWLTAHASVTPATVGALSEKWDFPTTAVTASPVLAGGLLYVSSWDGFVYALDPGDGSTTWSYDTGSGSFMGVQATPLVTSAGTVCVGDSAINVTCLDSTTGAVVWGPVNLGVGGVDNIWSGLAESNGRLFVSVSSILDTPCTKGRLVALDLATGAHLWTKQTVPDRICQTDTTEECATNSDCSLGGDCVDAVGAGMTATVSFDPSGDALYMNPVSCFTFPSVGDSDSIKKVDATDGSLIWQTRITPIEQFGFCADTPEDDCGLDGDCTTGTCTVPKGVFRDTGFLNGPNPVEVPDGAGTKTLLISGSKNGTLYALNESDGSIAWTNEVRPHPVAPGFAGFGLFNGPLAIADGRVFAALFQLAPARVCDNDPGTGCTADGDCLGGSCLSEPDHLMAFDASDGSLLWSDDIGPSWSAVSVVDGVVYVGTNDTDPADDSSTLFAYSAETGARLSEFKLPKSTVSRAVVDGDSLYVGYGIFGPGGGVRALHSACPSVPRLDCLTAEKSALQIKNRGGKKNQLKWKFSKGEAFAQGDLGNPVDTTDYSLCVYDSAASSFSVSIAATIASGTNWRDLAPKGFKFKDKTGANAGINAVQLKTGQASKSKMQVKAKGSRFVPALAAGPSTYFAQGPQVTAQLSRSDGTTCWSSTFTSAKSNTPEQFKAIAP